jgi:hypothetical protein
MSRKQRKLEERLSREGTFARGEMVALKRHKLQNAPNTYTWDVTARYAMADGTQVESKRTVDFLAWEPPEVGNAVTIRYDPQDPELWVWEDHPPDLGGGSAQVVIEGESVESRLDRLKGLKDQGVIDDAEYAEQRRRILDSL